MAPLKWDRLATTLQATREIRSMEGTFEVDGWAIILLTRHKRSTRSQTETIFSLTLRKCANMLAPRPALLYVTGGRMHDPDLMTEWRS